MRILRILQTSFPEIKGAISIKQTLEKKEQALDRLRSNRREEKTMATKIGSRGFTYPNSVMRSANASRSGEAVLFGGANLHGGGGPTVKWRGRRRGGEIGGESQG